MSGYRLARDAAEVSVSDIVSAVGEGIDATRCGGAGDCQDGHQCLTHGLWVDLSEQIDEFLGAITLAALVERRATRRVAQRQNQQNQPNQPNQPNQVDDDRIAAQNLV